MAKKNNDKKPKGAVLVLKSGKVMRTRPTGISGTVNYDAIDTSGYSKGKKGFAKESSTLYVGKTVMGPVVQRGKNVQYTPVKRKDVLDEISRMKKGAGKTTDFRDKKASTPSKFSKVKDKKVLTSIKNAYSKVKDKMDQKAKTKGKYKF